MLADYQCAGYFNGKDGFDKYRIYGIHRNSHSKKFCKLLQI